MLIVRNLYKPDYYNYLKRGGKIESEDIRLI